MKKLNLNISLESCKLLDDLLRAFGDSDHLDKNKVLDIFSGDESEAVKHINILTQLRYIRKIAEIEGSRLGMLFFKESSTDLLLAQGGLTSQFLSSLEEKKVDDKRQGLADENARLENEALKYHFTIREQENRIRILDEKLKRFEVLKNYEWLIRLIFVLISAALTWWFTRFT